LPESPDIVDISDDRGISAHQRRDLRYPETPLLPEQLIPFSDELCLLFLQRSWPWGEEHFQIVRASVCTFYVIIVETRGFTRSQISLTGKALGELRETFQERKRRSTVTTLIEEAYAMLNASGEHKKAPEQGVGSRGVLG